MTTREDMKSLAEEIVDTYADRIAGIAELRDTVKMNLKDLHTHLAQLRDSRVAASAEIKSDLARDTADRKGEVGDMLRAFGMELKELGKIHTAMSRQRKADLAKSITDRRHEVTRMLNGFGAELKKLHSGRLVLTKEMKADLAKGVSDLKDGVTALLKGFDTELKGIRSQLAGARDEWRVLSTTMQARRGGVAVEVKPSLAVAIEITPEIGDIRGQLFEHLANHPDGVKMTELEQEFGLARIQVAKVVKSLMDENKVTKRELLYFAI